MSSLSNIIQILKILKFNFIKIFKEHCRQNKISFSQFPIELILIITDLFTDIILLIKV